MPHEKYDYSAFFGDVATNMAAAPGETVTVKVEEGPLQGATLRFSFGLVRCYTDGRYAMDANLTLFLPGYISAPAGPDQIDPDFEGA